MTKRYSIAEARAHLPSIVDEVEIGKAVELTRRGKPVAVVLSLQQYELLSTARSNFADAYRAFRAKFGSEDILLDTSFADELRASGTGRKVEL
jgi:prevent-host-death family protein